MKSQINILLPDISYSYPRNEAGVRHHLYDLYSKVFSGHSFTVFPTRRTCNILSGVIHNFFRIKPGSLNVVTQGYSVLATYMATVVRRDICVVIHTWKVPGFSDDKITAYIYDYILRKLIIKSQMVVVASKKQAKQLQILFPSITTFFAPVTVNTEYWAPKSHAVHLLAKYDLKENAYVLTVGGNDRKEEVSMRVARSLDLPYVRVTKNQSVIDHVKCVEKKMNISKPTIILNNISDDELIALYQCAFVVLLPTITETNPAGLSSLVEALSCSAVVAVGSDLAEGYVVDSDNGIVFGSQNINDIAERLKSIGEGERERLKDNARRYAISSLRSDIVAVNLQQALHKV